MRVVLNVPRSERVQLLEQGLLKGQKLCQLQVLDKLFGLVHFLRREDYFLPLAALLAIVSERRAHRTDRFRLGPLRASCVRGSCI